MEILRRTVQGTRRLGILSGAFHPVTRAHLALADAALGRVDEVLFVMPRAFPHKAYEEVSLEQRLQLVLLAIAEESRFSVGVTEGGLFVEIAREARQSYPDLAELWFLCGRDAAERIVNWDYGHPEAIHGMLEEFGLLVADRAGRYVPPADLAHAIERLPLLADWSEVSSSEVRRRIRNHEPWEHLVPETIAEQVRPLYTG